MNANTYAKRDRSSVREWTFSPEDGVVVCDLKEGFASIPLQFRLDKPVYPVLDDDLPRHCQLSISNATDSFVGSLYARSSVYDTITVSGPVGEWPTDSIIDVIMLPNLDPERTISLDAFERCASLVAAAANDPLTDDGIRPFRDNLTAFLIDGGQDALDALETNLSAPNADPELVMESLDVLASIPDRASLFARSNLIASHLDHQRIGVRIAAAKALLKSGAAFTEDRLRERLSVETSVLARVTLEAATR